MSSPNESPVKTKTGGRQKHVVRLHPEKLSSAAEDAAQTSTERKFNMRIKKHDRMLLDTLAKATGRSRSDLISELLHHIMFNELMSIEKLDARMFVAQTADCFASYDPMDRHWTIDVLAGEINWMVRNVMTHGGVAEAQPLPDGMGWQHSSEFNALSDKLNEVVEEVPIQDEETGYGEEEWEWRRSPQFVTLRNKLKEVRQ